VPDGWRFSGTVDAKQAYLFDLPVMHQANGILVNDAPQFPTAGGLRDTGKTALSVCFDGMRTHRRHQEFEASPVEDFLDRGVLLIRERLPNRLPKGLQTTGLWKN
jgi:hypothetical protein